MSKFRVGDVVQACAADDCLLYGGVHNGDIGLVVAVNDEGAYIDWGHYVGGHTCEGLVQDGNGTYVCDCKLRLVEHEDKIEVSYPNEENISVEALEGIL